jgi:hypothetical protein
LGGAGPLQELGVTGVEEGGAVLELDLGLFKDML